MRLPSSTTVRGFAVTTAVLAATLAVTAAPAVAAPRVYLATTVGVGASPTGVAVDPSTGTAYVTNFGGDSVSVLRDGVVTSTVPVAGGPNGIAVDPTTHAVYVSTVAGQNLTVLDGSTGATTTTVPLGGAGGRVVVDPRTHTVYVTVVALNAVVVVDASTAAVTGRVTVAAPAALAIDPGVDSVYVGGRVSGGVTRISTVTGQIAGAVTPNGVSGVGALTVDLGSHRVYGTSPTGQQVFAFDGPSGGNPVAASAPQPGSIALDPGRALFLGDRGSSLVQVLDPATLRLSTTVDAASTMANFSFDPGSGHGYFVDQGDNAVIVVAAGDPPTVSTVSPAAGRYEGGQTVVVSGTDLTGATSVRFGSADAASFTVDSPTQVTAVVPPGAADQTVDLVVTTRFGTSAALPFQYLGEPASLVVTPVTSSAAAGGTAAFSAEAFDDQDRSLGDVTADTTFVVSNGGTCTGAECEVGTALGDVTATGTYGDLTDTAVVTVGPGPLARLQVTAVPAALTAGGTVRLTAIGFDAYDHALGDVTTQVTFDADRGGSCDADGCVLTSSGPRTVTGTAGAVTGTARVAVKPAAFDHIDLVAARTSAVAGSPKVFVVRAYDAYGNARGDVTADSVLVAGGSGTCAAGSCTWQRVGRTTVSATYGSWSDTLDVRVVPGPLARITVSPATATVTVGASQTYLVLAYDGVGNRLGVVTSGSTFTVAGSATCDGATCTTSAPGRATVSVSYGGLTVTAVLRAVAPASR